MFSRFLAAAAAVFAGVVLTAQAPAPIPPAPLSPPLDVARDRQTPLPLHAIVIDPGHGGDDAGVRMSDDASEKALTLAVARRIKADVESKLGIRAVLTRDDDRAVAPDERAAIANNNRADMFFSLHFNAALAPSVAGAVVYYASLDRESEEAMQASQADAVNVPVAGGATRSLTFIRWDLAQARHLARSGALAGAAAEQLRAHVPMAARSIQQTPLRGLMGVDMPAVLLELAYLTNPAQAKAAASPDFHGAVAQAVYDTIQRVRSLPVEGEQ